MVEFSSQHIGRRVQYTERNGNVKYGTIQAEPVNGFVDLKLENSARTTFFVPQDMIVLVDEDGVPQVE